MGIKLKNVVYGSATECEKKVILSVFHTLLFSSDLRDDMLWKQKRPKSQNRSVY